MKSMTGYGRAELQTGELSLSVEIKGYNGRFLDIKVSLPPALSPLEPDIREYAALICGRGSVEVSVRYRELNAALKVTVNKEAAKAYYEAASALSAALGLSETLPLSGIMDREGVLDIERTSNVEWAWVRIRPELEKAAAAFNAERAREGGHTRADILSHLALLETSLAVIASLRPILDEKLKNNVTARFAELLGDGLDENRVFAETAALLVKYTVSEEISRLAAHLAEFRALTEKDGGEPLGKKLVFLSHEMHREINTIGSKAVMLEASREVMNMKNALENIREQLRNVE
jgi:uncharacterized protein (TIGR00255 family)